MPQPLKKFFVTAELFSVIGFWAVLFAFFAFAVRTDSQGDQTLADKAPGAAVSPFVENHAHLDPADVEGSIRTSIQAMGRENAVKIVFMPSPFAFEEPGRFDAEIILAVAKKYPGKLAVLGGGGSLNGMIQESVRSGDAGSEVQKKFRERAEAILRAGAVGFGEMTAEHFSGATAYQYAPPDHPLFLLLADIAAQHGAPVDLHMEAVPSSMALPADLKHPPNPPQLHENIASFERLLAHNPRAKIVWAHAGSDYSGYRTPDICRRLLQAHTNLYMEIKIDPLSVGKNSPLENGASGKIKPEWLKLFQDFPDRFLIGSDQHYGPGENLFSGQQRWQTVMVLFNQLPPGLRRKIGIENPRRLYTAGK